MKRIFQPIKKKTILIVDDDQVAVHMYQEEFQSQGFKVEVAGNGHNAMQGLPAAFEGTRATQRSGPSGQSRIAAIPVPRRAERHRRGSIAAASVSKFGGTII